MSNIFPFCIGMLITYYIAAVITRGVYSVYKKNSMKLEFVEVYMMKPVEYAWNEHERQLYIENKIIIPSPYKIKIIDDVDDSEIDRIKKEGIDSEVQIIVFARRSCWIDECIAPLDNYYYINGGKMIKMINGIEKEIKRWSN